VVASVSVVKYCIFRRSFAVSEHGHGEVSYILYRTAPHSLLYHSTLLASRSLVDMNIAVTTWVSKWCLCLRSPQPIPRRLTGPRVPMTLRNARIVSPPHSQSSSSVIIPALGFSTPSRLQDTKSRSRKFSPLILHFPALAPPPPAPLSSAPSDTPAQPPPQPTTSDPLNIPPSSLIPAPFIRDASSSEDCKSRARRKSRPSHAPRGLPASSTSLDPLCYSGSAGATGLFPLPSQIRLS
jgi:hypothetical protein